MVENTFLDIPTMVDELMPKLAYFKKLVLRIAWDNAAIVRRLELPILFIAGEKDELVPPQHMKGLHAQCKSGNKSWYPVANGTHNDTWVKGGKAYFDKLADFIQDVSWVCIPKVEGEVNEMESIPQMPNPKHIASLKR